MKTLDSVTDEWSDTREIAKRLRGRIGQPALSNRLNVLAAAGFVEWAHLTEIRGYAKHGDGYAKVWRRKQEEKTDG